MILVNPNFESTITDNPYTLDASIHEFNDYDFKSDNSELKAVILSGVNKLDYYDSNYSTNVRLGEFVDWGSKLSTASNYGDAKRRLSRTANIKKIIIGTDMTTIGNECFINSKKMTDVKLRSVITIGTSAFRECDMLENIDLGDKLKIIGYGAFLDCPKITSINLPQTLTHIGENAFLNTNIENIFIPKSVKWIGVGCFSKSKFDSSGHRLGRALAWIIISGPDFMGNTAEYTDYPLDSLAAACSLENTKSNSLKSIIFEDNSELSVIEGACFRGCTGLTSFKMPEKIKHINWHAFEGCENITDIDMSKTTTLDIIRESAFEGCTSLANLELKNTMLKTIEKNAFTGCTSLTSLNFPITLATIGEAAFFNCSKLKTFKYGAEMPDAERDSADMAIRSIPSLVNPNAFEGCDQNWTIDVPNYLYNSFIHANNWKDVSSHIICKEIPQTDPTINVNSRDTYIVDNNKDISIGYFAKDAEDKTTKMEVKVAAINSENDLVENP